MSRKLMALLISLLFVALPALADINPPEIETSKQFGARIVYYNVFPATDLKPEIAASYQIKRNSDQVVVNISLRGSGQNDSQSLPATVTGTYSDLMEIKNLTFREFREEGGICYIAQLRVTNRELLRFDILVQPAFNTERGESPTPPLPITFTRRFAVDD